MTVPSRLRMYYEYLTLRLEKNGLHQDHPLPLVSAWQWNMTIDGQDELLWLPERQLLPTDRAVKTIAGSTKFHQPRKQRVRFILASNGAGTLIVDGQKVLDYTAADFMPMTHRAAEGTFADVDLALGLHTLEFTLSFATDQPRAALLLADAANTLLIHDVTVATDLTQ